MRFAATIAAALALTTGLAAANTALAQNAAEIARVKAGGNCKGCNLFQADLSGGLELKAKDFSRARLRQANLSLSIFNRTNFKDADLRDIDGYGALFSNANLRDADLTNASLVGAYFDGADLTGAKLAGANLSGAELDHARGLTQKGLAQACGDASTRLPTGLTAPSC